MPTLEQFRKAGIRTFVSSATVALNPAERRMDIKDARFGSGVLVRRGPRVFVATSAHYLDLVPPEEMTIIFPGKEHMVAVSMANAKEKLARRGGWTGERTRALPLNPIWQKRGTDLEDVAVLEIHPESAPTWCEIYDLDRHSSRRVPQEGDEVLVAGLPTANHLISRERPAADGCASYAFGRLLMVRYYKVAKIGDPENYLGPDLKRGFFPDYHFAVSYDPQQDVDKTHPQGLSGCGVWRMNYSSTVTGLEVPDPVLVGIENSFHAERKCLKVTSIDRVVRLLD